MLQNRLMAKTVPVSEGKARLTEVVRDTEAEDVVFTRHGIPVAVMVMGLVVVGFSPGWTVRRWVGLRPCLDHAV